MAVDNTYERTYNESISKEDLKKLLDLIQSTKYGSVTTIIQDGKVIQIEKSEKIRLK